MDWNLLLKIFSTEALLEICNHASMILVGESRIKETLLYIILANAYTMRIGGGSNDVLRLFVGRTELNKKVDKRFLPPILKGVTKEEIEELKKEFNIE